MTENSEFSTLWKVVTYFHPLCVFSIWKPWNLKEQFGIPEKKVRRAHHHIILRCQTTQGFLPSEVFVDRFGLWSVNQLSKIAALLDKCWSKLWFHIILEYSVPKLNNSNVFKILVKLGKNLKNAKISSDWRKVKQLFETLRHVFYSVTWKNIVKSISYWGISRFHEIFVEKSWKY